MLLLVGLNLATAAMAGEKRYVVPITILGDKLNEYPLWTSANWSRSCDQATLHGTMHEIQLFCETGVAGLKPLVGRLPVGTEVELHFTFGGNGGRGQRTAPTGGTRTHDS